MLKLFGIACVLSIPLSAQSAPDRPIETSVTELSEHAKEFDGHLVRVLAVLIFWMGGRQLFGRPLKIRSLVHALA